MRPEGALTEGVLKRAGRAASAVFAAAALLWPFAILAGIRFGGLREVIFAADVVLSLRAMQPGLAPFARLASLACAILCSAALLLSQESLVFWYPVLVNGALLALFAGSLLWGPPVAERLARLSFKEGLPQEAVRYCRKATAAWCGFFLVNGLVALGTVLAGDADVWTLWNGCFSYVFLGAFALCEYGVRRRVQRAAESSLP